MKATRKVKGKTKLDLREFDTDVDLDISMLTDAAEKAMEKVADRIYRGVNDKINLMISAVISNGMDGEIDVHINGDGFLKITFPAITEMKWEVDLREYAERYAGWGDPEEIKELAVVFRSLVDILQRGEK